MIRSLGLSAAILGGVFLAAACTVTDGDGDGDGTNDAGASSSGSSGASSSGSSSGNTNTDGGSSGNTDPDSGADRGECTPYTPAVITGSESGSFTESGTVIKYLLPKTDIGGGLLEVTYNQGYSVTGSIFLNEGANPNVARVERGAFGPPATAEGQPVKVTYRLAGDKSYELGISSFSFNAEKPDYKIDYVYQPLVDCYEGNDTAQAAKKIPVNTAISAYHHVGIGAEDTSLVSESGDDWYRFELTEPKTVKVRANFPGQDGGDGQNTAIAQVYEADGVAGVRCTSVAYMETDPAAAVDAVETCDGVLPAGSYLVKVSLFTSQYSSTEYNKEPYISWNTPYALTVDAN